MTRAMRLWDDDAAGRAAAASATRLRSGRACARAAGTSHADAQAASATQRMEQTVLGPGMGWSVVGKKQEYPWQPGAPSLSGPTGQPVVSSPHRSELPDPSRRVAPHWTRPP